MRSGPDSLLRCSRLACVRTCSTRSSSSGPCWRTSAAPSWVPSRRMSLRRAVSICWRFASVTDATLLTCSRVFRDLFVGAEGCSVAVGVEQGFAAIPAKRPPGTVDTDPCLVSSAVSPGRGQSLSAARVVRCLSVLFAYWGSSICGGGAEWWRWVS